MPWNLDSSRPIYLQIIERVQMDIITGRYQPGDKLPSVRDLAQEAAVNPNTMQKALSELERSGLVYSQRTSVLFICFAIHLTTCRGGRILAYYMLKKNERNGKGDLRIDRRSGALYRRDERDGVRG